MNWADDLAVAALAVVFVLIVMTARDTEHGPFDDDNDRGL